MIERDTNAPERENIDLQRTPLESENRFRELDEFDPRCVALERVLSTKAFLRAPRLSAFLRYVGERSILDRTHEITEQQIGVHVFGRPADYNPGDDNVVRHTARQLRQRLALFYQEEGAEELLRISMPRGGYLLEFSPNTSEHSPIPNASDLDLSVFSKSGHSRHPAAETRNDDATPHTEDVRSNSTRYDTTPSVPLVRRPFYFHGLFGTLCLLALLLAVSAYFTKRVLHPAEDTDLWTTLFPDHEKAVIVLGDAGLNLYFDMTGHKVVPTQEYAARSYLTRQDAQYPLGDTPFADRRYTTMSDVKLVQHLYCRKGIRPDRVEIRFARSIQAELLKSGNALLIGAPNYDPWVSLFDADVDFRFDYGNGIDVTNRAPRQGELTAYADRTADIGTNDKPRTGYAILSLTDNLQKTGRVLLVEGKSMDDIEAATEFLFNDEDMKPILQQARDRNHKLSNFDVLLETASMKGYGLKAKVAAVHTHGSRL